MNEEALFDTCPIKEPRQINALGSFFLKNSWKTAYFLMILRIYLSFFGIILFICLFFSYNRKGMSEGENI